MTLVDSRRRANGELDDPVADKVREAFDAVGLDELLTFDRFAHVDRETVDVAVEELARVAGRGVVPPDRGGDGVGWQHDPATGRVVTPPGFREAYQRFVDAGWNAVAVPVEHGGGGLPRTVGVALQELFAAANVGLSLCPALTQSAIELLMRWGTNDQQRVYLPRLVTGEWAGTMWITEPDAGSDVGAIRSVATSRPDGRWEITGTKIFISWGDHDLTDDIIHFVLARTPGSAPGTRGLSLFLVPARLVDDHGQPDALNRVTVRSLEHKLGLHASPTCVMELDGAIGELVGDVGSGMRAMFTMMSPARLSIGLQGLGIGERAYRAARSFAGERRQGRAVGAPPGTVSVIDEHPDVRWMLSRMSSAVDAMRQLGYWTARNTDRAAAHPDPAVRERAQDLVDLLTPITKAWVTDTGVEVASLGIQVHGGMGYIEDTTAPQRWRDARIGPIYEGTNGIQAIDLVTRKVTRHDGAVVMGLLDDVDATAVRSPGQLGDHLAEAASAVRVTTTWLLDRLADGDGADDALAGATTYLSILGDLVSGWLLARRALDQESASTPGADHAWDVASFFVVERVATISGRCAAITAGASRLLV
ncbi:MAG: acyl-CoA dehydrogenase [Acidimicrobiales bacterium]